MVTVIDTPTYELDGWAGNATDDYGVDWIVTNESGWSDGAPVRLTTSDREGIDGGISGPVLRGARLITLSGVAMAPSRLAMLAAKDRWHTFAASAPASVYPLVVAEEHMTRQADVKLAGEPKAADVGSVSFRWELLLRADDPLRYATDLTLLATELPTGPESGLTFNAVFPLTFGGGGTGGALYAINTGNAPVWPVLTINGPVSNPSVQNLASGRTVAFDISLAADESLVIDMAARTVLLNGTANRRNALLASSSWWQIEPGSNEIQFRAAALTAASLQITYRSAWK